MEYETFESVARGSHSIHDNWTQLLDGTRFLLDLIDEGNIEKVRKRNLRKLVLVSCFQMTEIMFFMQLKTKVELQEVKIKQLFQYDLDQRISFYEARQKWPEILTGKELDSSSGPLQSLFVLSKVRNSVVHHEAESPDIDISECAFYTAIEISKVFYEHFNDKTWDESNYKDFEVRNMPKVDVLLTSENVFNGR